MISIKSILPIIFLITVLIPSVLAAPVIVDPYWVSSNNATINVTEITGTVAWVIWGQNPGGECWNTPNQTPGDAGNANFTIWGAPILGNTKYFVRACDVTGCGNEMWFRTAQITVMPTTTFGAGFRNLTESHFNVLYIPAAIFTPLTTFIPLSIISGILFGIIFFGFAVRTRNVGYAIIMFMILSGFILDPTHGLYLGLPLPMQAIGQALMAAGLAGLIMTILIKK